MHAPLAKRSKQSNFKSMISGSNPGRGAMEKHMEQDNDYVNELLNKWMPTMFGVREQDRTKVAQRLEAAHRRSLGQRGDAQAVQRELNILRREGYFAQR